MAVLKADSTTPALVLECKKTLLSLTRMAKLRLTWVPGHSGVVRIYNDCIVVEPIASTLIVVLAQFFDFL